MVVSFVKTFRQASHTSLTHFVYTNRTAAGSIPRPCENLRRSVDTLENLTIRFAERGLLDLGSLALTGSSLKCLDLCAIDHKRSYSAQELQPLISYCKSLDSPMLNLPEIKQTVNNLQAYELFSCSSHIGLKNTLLYSVTLRFYSEILTKRSGCYRTTPHPPVAYLQMPCFTLKQPKLDRTAMAICTSSGGDHGVLGEAWVQNHRPALHRHSR